MMRFRPAPAPLVERSARNSSQSAAEGELGLGSGRIGFSELQNHLELAAFDNFSEPHRLSGMLGTNPCPETNLNGRIGL